MAGGNSWTQDYTGYWPYTWGLLDYTTSALLGVAPTLSPIISAGVSGHTYIGILYDGAGVQVSGDNPSHIF